MTEKKTQPTINENNLLASKFGKIYSFAWILLISGSPSVCVCVLLLQDNVQDSREVDARMCKQ